MVVPVLSAGRTLALPVNRVCGVSGHSVAIFRFLNVASACGKGWAAQGMTRAVALACGLVVTGDLLFAGGVLTCRAALICKSVSGPRAVT